MGTATALRRLRAVGFPLPGWLRSAPVWRASATSKLHNQRVCSRLRGNGQLVATDVIAAGDDDWCSTCWPWATDGELGEWLSFATKVLRLAEHLDRARTGELSALTTLRVTAADVAGASACDGDLAARRADLLDAAEQLITEHLMSPGAQRRAALAAAAERMGAHGRTEDGLPAGTRVEWVPPVGVKKGYSPVRYCGPLVATWAHLRAKVRDGVPLADAAESARTEGRACLDEAFDANRVPDTTRLDRSRFDHPTAWAHAEWRLVAKEELDRAVSGWCAQLNSAADDDDWVVADVEWPTNEVTDRHSLLAPFPAVTYGHRALVCAPDVVYRSYRATRPHGTVSNSFLLAEHRVPLAVLSTAAPLVAAAGYDTDERAQVFAACELIV